LSIFCLSHIFYNDAQQEFITISKVPVARHIVFALIGYIIKYYMILASYNKSKITPENHTEIIYINIQNKSIPDKTDTETSFPMNLQ